MPQLPRFFNEFLRQVHSDPVIVQTLRSTVAATLAYLTALALLDVRAPLLAPLTALLVVQVTLFGTLTSGIRRVNSVIVGVVVAVGFSTLVGLSWWSLGLLILAAQSAGRIARVQEFVPEAAISAMLVLNVTHVTQGALGRVLETLIGAAVGLLLNTVLLPPVWVESAGEDIEDLARRMRELLARLGDEAGQQYTPVERVEARLLEARQLDHDVAHVDTSLSQAEESLRFNPRVREGLLTRLVLRTGLDTLEVCTVVLRSMSRTLTEMAALRTEEPLFPPQVATGVRELYAHLAGAVDSFAVLITTQATTSAEEAESRLIRELEASHASRERVAFLLLGRVREHPRQWQLHGSLLSEVDRLLDELDVQKRSLRLAEELDRYSRERRRKGPWQRLLPARWRS